MKAKTCTYLSTWGVTYKRKEMVSECFAVFEAAVAQGVEWVAQQSDWLVV